MPASLPPLLPPQPQQGYSISILKSLLLYPLAILPACLGLLLAYWFPSVWIKLTCWKCPLDRATFVIVKVWRVEGGGWRLREGGLW